jgi:hypothetical protein
MPSLRPDGDYLRRQDRKINASFFMAGDIFFGLPAWALVRDAFPPSGNDIDPRGKSLRYCFCFDV